MALAALLGGAVTGISGASATATLHVGATSSGGAGTGLNLIPSNSEFFVFEEAGQDVASPITIYFAAPVYTASPAPPIVTSVVLDGTTSASFTAVADTGIGYTSDKLSILGNSSLSIVNFDAGETANGIPVPTGFEIFDTVVSAGMNGKDFFDVKGSFGQGTYIAPVGDAAGKEYTTQFTNIGLITAPEPSTWAMMALGFLGLGYVAFGPRSKKIISASLANKAHQEVDGAACRGGERPRTPADPEVEELDKPRLIQGASEGVARH
jgi:hypothetical protein